MTGNKFKIEYTKTAAQDLKILLKSEYRKKALELLEVIQKDPYQNPPSFKYLSGDGEKVISRRINIQHRITYQVIGDVIKIRCCWTHYHG